MTAQEKKQMMMTDVIKQLKTMKIPKMVVPYIDQFINSCNLHQLQNLISNMPELTKFIKQTMTS